MEFNPEIFDDIRPYYDEEINPALRRIAAHPNFPDVIRYLFPEETIEGMREFMLNIHSSMDFQKRIMHKVIRSIIRKSSDGLTFEGFDHIRTGQAYAFISNHRDILLDSAILQILLVENGFDTSEITFGSNLMTSQLVVDIGKINRMFVVYRNGGNRDRLRNSLHLSEYIRYALKEKKNSIWIAQRAGRTKDGADRTDPAVLKMLSLYGRDLSFEENIRELNIVPYSISYEYEPCDILKARELCLSKDKPYEKGPDEDSQSVLAGIVNPKGRIHFHVGHPLDAEISEAASHPPSEQFDTLASLIDRQIISNYKLWPLNYIAYDLLKGIQSDNRHYSEEEKISFQNYIDQKIKLYPELGPELRIQLLEIYANPLISQKSLSGVKSAKTSLQ